MSSRPPPQRVPTLTEVVELREPAPATVLPLAKPDAAPAAGSSAGAAMEPPPLTLDDAASRRIYADLMRQVDLMLEYRLREALAPALARAAEGLVRDTRSELASTLRDVVARAVAQELARHRGP